jgi:putative DNA primase/helicase
VTIGTQSNPVEHAEPAKVANALLQSYFLTPNNRRGLWTHQGVHYAWEGHQWVLRDREWLRDACWNMLEDLYVNKIVNGIPVAVRYGVDQTKIGNVLEALCAKTRLPHVTVPCWLEPSDMDASRCITFEDSVVEVSDVVNVTPRDETWFSTSVIPCNYDPESECPTWMNCIQQWSGGDPEWIELLQRWFGYCLMPHNDYARWFLMYGKVRSGKGTIAKILESLLGLDSYFGVSLYSLSNRFGLDGLQASRVMCVHEVSELDSKEGERCVQVLKTVLGQDRIDIDRKGLPMVRNVVIPAKAMMQTNEMPRLPNKGQGLSSKMLVLPFDVSFHGKEDELNLGSMARLGKEEPRARANSVPKPDSSKNRAGE